MKNILFFILLFIYNFSFSQNEGNIIKWNELIETNSISAKNQKLIKYFFDKHNDRYVIEIDTIYSINSNYLIGLLCYSNDKLSEEKTVFLTLINEKFKFIDSKFINTVYAIYTDGGNIYFSTEIAYLDKEVHAIESVHSYNYCEMQNAPMIETESKSMTIFKIHENEKIDTEKRNIETKTFVKEKALKELEKLNKTELRLLRNYYFAKYDYKFNSLDLIEYFSNNLNNYNPINDDVADKLTEIDKFLIDYIKELEKKE